MGKERNILSLYHHENNDPNKNVNGGKFHLDNHGIKEIFLEF